MKQILIYIAGMLLLLPCCLISTDNLLVDIFVLVYTLVIIKSPCYSQKARRFWRLWHKENFRILLTIK